MKLAGLLKLRVECGGERGLIEIMGGLGPLQSLQGATTLLLPFLLIPNPSTTLNSQNDLLNKCVSGPVYPLFKPVNSFPHHHE